jgi:hypothetical protein
MKKIIVLLLCFIFLFSCNKDKVNENFDIDLNLKISNYLRQQGFDVSTIQDFGTHIVVENDIVFDKSALLSLSENVDNPENFELHLLGDGVEERQYVNNPTSFVSMNNALNIKYYIDNSVANIPNVGSQWVTSIITATQNWTNISNCRITFVAVNTHAQANVSFFADNNSTLPPALQNLPPNSQNSNQVPAAADWPVNGNAGRFISINDATSGWSMNTANRVKYMMHEIGHAVGLRHDNAAATEGSATQIQGTPIIDATSIMIQGLSQNVLSPSDIKAAQFLYPDGYSTPIINNIVYSSSGYVTLQTAAPASQSPYKVIVVRRNMAGTVQQYHEFFAPGNTTNFTVPCPAGMWTFEIAYSNFGTYGFVSGKYPVVSGTCELKRKNSTKCLDAANCGTGNGTNVQVWEDNNLPCQRWIVTLESDGYYELKMQNSPTRNLDVLNCGTANGTNVRLWDDFNNSCQRWKITLESDGFFELKPKVAPTKNLDVASCISNVQIYDDLSNDCQRWQITVF